MALCSAADVEAIIGEDPGTITTLIELVGERIAGIIGRTVDPAVAGELTVKLEGSRNGRRGAILTPHWPLADISVVTEGGDTLVADEDYAVELEAGLIVRLASATSWSSWSTAYRPVTATYNLALPADVRAIAASIAGRVWLAGRASAATPAGMGGLKQLTIGRWSATSAVTPGEVAKALEFTPADLAGLGKWKDRRP